MKIYFVCLKGGSPTAASEGRRQKVQMCKTCWANADRWCEIVGIDSTSDRPKSPVYDAFGGLE